MILRPTLDDFKIIGYYTGRIILYLGMMMLLPLTISSLLQEWDSVVWFAIGSSVCFIVGFSMSLMCRTHKEITSRHANVIAPGVWVLAVLLGAIPLYLSGHYGAYIDACFEVMSGFTTTGLTMVKDLDHAAWGVNIWRHLMMFIGGQGIVLAAILFLAPGVSGSYHVFAGEARGEKILPNVGQTVRFIWMVSIVYLIIGTLATWAAIVWSGAPVLEGLLHGACVFMAAFSTGGFTPQSQSILYYHSVVLEAVTIFLIIGGSLNFSLHFALWTGSRREIYKNIESRTLMITILAISFLVGVGLMKTGSDPNFAILMRKGFYHVVSGHAGCGFATVYPSQFLTDWRPMAFGTLILAMGLGGCASSTAGGIKAMRVAINFKVFIHEIKRLLSPPSAVLVLGYHHIKEIILEDSNVRMILLITMAFIATYITGAVLVSFYGYPLDVALFESVSATANVGLSAGITDASMPWMIKMIFIIQMWLGRMEFFPVMAFFGIFLARIWGR